MKLPRPFYQPLAIGAPEPLRELPVRLERMIHFVPPHIEKVTVKFEVSKALKDIKHQYGEVKAGTVGGQHYEWTAWVEGAPLIVYHFYWQLGEDLDPLRSRAPGRRDPVDSTG